MKATARSKVLPLILFLTTSVAWQVAKASTVVVGTCNPSLPQFNTIQAAVTAVPAGGTVDVCPGPYYEQVNITKKLTLIGVSSGGSDAAVIYPPSGGLVTNGSDIFGNPVAAQIFVNSPSGNVTISHLTVDGTGNNLAGCAAPTLEGIYYQDTSGTITDDAVRNQYQTNYAAFGGCQNGLAINVEATTSANLVTVSNNSVRAYQKNGITATGAGTGAGSPGPTVTINGNYIVGLGATAMNWQGVYSGEGTAGENGVQVGFGAGGKVSNNIVNDNIWGQDTSSDTGDAASGILIFASSGITVSGNEVGSAQFSIAAETDGFGFCSGSSGPISCGTADSTTITSNKIAGTQIFDGIDACSNNNLIETNTIYGSTESGVHLDDTCTNSGLGTTSGNNNTVMKNTINEACAGVLEGTGSPNTVTPNTFMDVTNTLLAGDVCPAPGAAASAAKVAVKLRPSPFKSNRR